MLDTAAWSVCKLHITENRALSGKNAASKLGNTANTPDLYKYSVNKHKEIAEKCLIFYEKLRNMCAKFDKTA